MEKIRQNAENKQMQTFDLEGKNEIEGKTRQNAESKQTFDLTTKIVFEGKIKCNHLAFKMSINLIKVEYYLLPR